MESTREEVTEVSSQIDERGAYRWGDRKAAWTRSVHNKPPLAFCDTPTVEIVIHHPPPFALRRVTLVSALAFMRRFTLLLLENEPIDQYTPYIEAFDQAIDGLTPAVAERLEAMEYQDPVCDIFMAQEGDPTASNSVASILWGGKTANTQDGDGVLLFFEGDEVWAPWPPGGTDNLSVYIGKQDMALAELQEALRLAVRTHAHLMRSLGYTTRMNIPVSFEDGVRMSWIINLYRALNERPIAQVAVVNLDG